MQSHKSLDRSEPLRLSFEWMGKQYPCHTSGKLGGGSGSSALWTLCSCLVSPLLLFLCSGCGNPYLWSFPRPDTQHRGVRRRQASPEEKLLLSLMDSGSSAPRLSALCSPEWGVNCCRDSGETVGGFREQCTKGRITSQVPQTMDLNPCCPGLSDSCS